MLPGFQNSFGHLPGKLGFTRLEEASPEEPLEHRPNSSIPISLRIVGRGEHVHRGNAKRGVEPLRIHHLRDEPILVCGQTSEERQERAGRAISGRSLENHRLYAPFGAAGPAVETAFLIPHAPFDISCQQFGVFAELLGVRPVSEKDGDIPHDSGEAEDLRHEDERVKAFTR